MACIGTCSTAEGLYDLGVTSETTTGGLGSGGQGGGEDSTLRGFNFGVNVVVDGVLCLAGYVGNVLTIVVLQKAGVRTSNSVLLQVLAVVDSCFLTYVVLYVVLRSIYPYTGALGGIHSINNYLVAFVLPFGWTSQTATLWMVMALAVDRYLVVAYPLKSSRWCTPKNARWVSAGVVVAAVLFNLVRWPRYYFVAFRSGTSSNSTFVSHLSANIPGWNEDNYRNIYHISLTFVMLFIIPLSVISVVNVALMQALRRASKARNQLTAMKDKSKAQHASSNVTTMIIIMITIFVICQLPDFIAAIIGAGNFKVDDTVYSYYAGVKEALLVFNSACNFYLYLLFYRRFRRTMRKLCCCQPKQNQMRAVATHRSYTVTTVSSVSNQVAKSSPAATTTPSQESYRHTAAPH